MCVIKIESSKKIRKWQELFQMLSHWEDACYMYTLCYETQNRGDEISKFIDTGKTYRLDRPFFPGADFGAIF